MLRIPKCDFIPLSGVLVCAVIWVFCILSVVLLFATSLQMQMSYIFNQLYFVSLTQAGNSWEEGTPIEKLSPSDSDVCGHFLDF